MDRVYLIYKFLYQFCSKVTTELQMERIYDCAKKFQGLQKKFLHLIH